MMTNLTQERLKEVLSYDPETGLFRNKYARGRNIKAGAIAGSKSEGYLRIYIDGKRYGSHQLAWLYVYGEIPDGLIDHINGDGSDNRIANLRKASAAENAQNIRAAYSNSQTGLLGVSKMKSGRFAARIGINGKDLQLGTFDSAEIAHKAYLLAKQRLHPFQTIAELPADLAAEIYELKRPRNGAQKLTKAMVRQIIADTRSHAAVAAEFGLNGSTVSRIRSGKSWGGVL